MIPAAESRGNRKRRGGTGQRLSSVRGPARAGQHGPAVPGSILDTLPMKCPVQARCDTHTHSSCSCGFQCIFNFLISVV